MATVLIADDDPELLMLIRSILTHTGYQVDCAEDAFVAEQKLGEKAYDLLISDIEMPGNQDLALIRKLSQISPCTAVLLITAFPTVETAMQAVNLPVMAYLTKPCKREMLLERVGAAVSRSQALRVVAQSQDRCQQFERQLAQLKQLLIKNGSEGVDPPMGAYLGMTLEAMLGSLIDLTAYLEVIRNEQPSAKLAEAILDTIQVLEKTKRSFKSKDLGELRQRLERLVETSDSHLHGSPGQENPPAVCNQVPGSPRA
jgi:response regulator RpfG family c-di-GMP phosphodiesterase